MWWSFYFYQMFFWNHSGFAGLAFFSQPVINAVLFRWFINQLASRSRSLLLVSHSAQTHCVIHLYILSRSQFPSSPTVPLAATGLIHSATFGFTRTLAFCLWGVRQHKSSPSSQTAPTPQQRCVPWWLLNLPAEHAVFSVVPLLEPALPRYGPFLQDCSSLLVYRWSRGLQTGIDPASSEMDFGWVWPQLKPCDHVLCNLLGGSRDTVCFAESHHFCLCVILHSSTWKTSPSIVQYSWARGKEK